MAEAYEILRQSSEYPGLYEMGVPQEAQDSFALALGRYVMGDAHGFWFPKDCGDGHCDPDKLVVTMGQRIAALSDIYANGTGSPIEDRLVGSLLWLEMDWAGFPRVDYLNGPKDHLEQFGPREGIEFYITPQASIGKYRVDFLLWFLLGKHYGGVIVECDGHAYHDKTKEQAARDKRRDRELLASGYPVMRFTGSEIYKDAHECAEQVRVPLSIALDRVSKDGGLY